MVTIDIIWEKFTSRLERILPGCTSRFTSADDIAVDKFESEIGILLPVDFKRYLQIAGGRKEHGTPLPIFGHFALPSLIEIKASRKNLIFLFGDEPTLGHIPENKLKPCIWDPLWIPFMESNATDRLILDLNPGKNGHFGQIARDYPGIDRASDSVAVSRSFEDFVQETSDRLQGTGCQVKEGRIDFGNWP
jgi:cell wall assembly regulator SMI1